MGFLTSGLTEQQQQQNQANFTLGMTLGVQQLHQQQAAQNALAQVQMTNEAEEKRQMAIAEANNQEKIQAAQIRAQAMTDVSAEQARSRRIAGVERPFATITSKFLSGLDEYSKHPDVYSKETLQQAEEAKNKVLGFYSAGSAKLANWNPDNGDLDMSDVYKGIYNIPMPNVSFNPQHQDYIESRIDRNEATANKDNAKASVTYDPVTGSLLKGGKESKSLMGWQKGASEWQNALSDLNNQQVTGDAADPTTILPFKKLADAKRSMADANGVVASLEVADDPGDYGTLYRAMKKKGIQPLQTSTINQVGGFLYNIYANPRRSLSDDEKASLQKASLFYTGLPLDSFKGATRDIIGNAWQNSSATQPMGFTPSSSDSGGNGQ